MTTEEQEKFKSCIDRAESFVFDYDGKYCRFTTNLVENPKSRINFNKRAHLIYIIPDPTNGTCNFALPVKNLTPTFEQDENVCIISFDVEDNHFVFRFYGLKREKQ